jgi:hypothetical protein
LVQTRAKKPNVLEADGTQGGAVEGVFDALKGAGSKKIMEQLRARRERGKADVHMQEQPPKQQLPIGDFRAVLRKPKH